MLKLVSFVLFCFLGTLAVAQTHLKRTIEASSISLLQINADNCYELRLETVHSDEIVIEAQLEGEYSKDLELSVRQNGKTLVVDAGFPSDFIKPNDKLSAHKVVSIGLHVLLPQWKNVAVYGTNVRVVAKGDYSDLDIVLADGKCELNQVSKKATVKTQSGDITIKADRGSINAFSKYGTVEQLVLPKGLNLYNLSTVTGNIELRKPE